MLLYRTLSAHHHSNHSKWKKWSHLFWCPKKGFRITRKRDQPVKSSFLYLGLDLLSSLNASSYRSAIPYELGQDFNVLPSLGIQKKYASPHPQLHTNYSQNQSSYACCLCNFSICPAIFQGTAFYQ